MTGRESNGGVLATLREPDGLVGYRSALLTEVGVPHLFTTRIGPGGRDLDLAGLDDAARARIACAAGLEGAPLVTVTQVHGGRVIVLGPGEAPPLDAAADALVSTRADALVGVHVADCVPVLVARVDGQAVAAIHAGWRGLVAGVIPNAVARLAGDAHLVAAIGPCLSRERFEVGPEVVEAFAAAGLGATVHANPGRRPSIDLRDAAAVQLRATGIERIDASDRCTYEDAAELWSYRRDVTHGSRPRTGRLGAFVAAAPRGRGGLPRFSRQG